MYRVLINFQIYSAQQNTFYIIYLSILAMSAAVGLLFKQVIAKISYDGESKY